MWLHHGILQQEFEGRGTAFLSASNTTLKTESETRHSKQRVRSRQEPREGGRAEASASLRSYTLYFLSGGFLHRRYETTDDLNAKGRNKPQRPKLYVRRQFLSHVNCRFASNGSRVLRTLASLARRYRSACAAFIMTSGD